jgi:hypothetical protein
VERRENVRCRAEVWRIERNVRIVRIRV